MAEVKRREQMQGSRFALAAVLVIVLLTALAGCGKPSQASVEAMIQKAYTNTAEVQSLRWRETTNSIDSSREGQGITEGERVLPDRQHRKWGYQAPGIDISSEDFFIGTTTYSKFVQDREWRVFQRERAIDLRGLPFYPLVYLQFLTEPVRLEDAKIDSLRCLHYRGGVDIDSFLPAVTMPDPQAPGYSLSEQEREDLKAYLERMKQSKWVLKVWISEGDLLVRRLELDAIYSEDGGQPLFSERRVVEFYDFNTPIDIRPPI